MLKKIIRFIVSFIILIYTIAPQQVSALNTTTHYYQIYNNPDKLYINRYFKGTSLKVPLIIQTYKYPTGCESVSAVEVLQYYVQSLSVDSFIKQYLNTQDFIKSNNKMYNYTPDEYFIGNPFSHSGLGCYENVIIEALNEYFDDCYKCSLRMTSESKLTIDKIESLIDNSTPVIIWVTMDLNPSSKGKQWTLIGSNKLYTYRKNEHCMVITGYNDKYFYFNDSLRGFKAYPKYLVLQRYKEMGNHALIIEKG